MKTIMSRSPHDSSLSFSKRYFNWKNKVEDDGDNEREHHQQHQQNNVEDKILTFSLSSRFNEEDKEDIAKKQKPSKKRHSIVPVSKLRTALTVFGIGRIRSNHRPRVPARIVGTLFGYRRGHVYFALQENPKLNPTFLIELSTPTSVLVREMASGLVRITLECEKKEDKKKPSCKLLEEPLWRTYCNGRKCGYATRRECGAEEWKVLKAVEPITMGVGVLPGKVGNGAIGSEGELMYMRARFERVIGSKDSEAFYMMNPDFSGGPELSIYLLRV